jgi:predicted nuclease of predicted toxin-antitoxin system
VRFLADENFPRTSAQLLRSEGFDVVRIQEIAPAEEDQGVLSIAVEMERILLTLDRDFGELIFHKKLKPPPAVLFFRFDPAYPAEPFEILSEVLNEFDVIGNFTTITRRGVRQRPLA